LQKTDNRKQWSISFLPKTDSQGAYIPLTDYYYCL